MTFRPNGHLIGYQAIGDTSTVQNHPLGLIVQAVDPVYGVGEFIYLKGVASTVVGSAAVYNPDDFSTTLALAATIGAVGIAMSINVASQYGWYQINDKAIVKANTVVDDANVYSTAVAGVLDDAVVAGSRVKNAKFASADGTPSAGLAECEIWRPFLDNALAA